MRVRPGQNLSVPSPRCQRAYEQVVRQAQMLMEISQQPDELLLFRAEGVSGWNSSQHLDHLATSNRRIVRGIERALAAPAHEGGSRLTFVGRVVLLTGFIPRGKGKAPEASLPRSGSLEDVRENLLQAQRAVSELSERLGEIDACRGRFDHHVFGGFRPIEWLRFMQLHTRHHLKIIRDIQLAADSRR